MPLYLVFAIMFSSFMESNSGGFLLAILVVVVVVVNLASAYFLMKRETDEVKEGHTLFVVTRNPLTFTI